MRSLMGRLDTAAIFGFIVVVRTKGNRLEMMSLRRARSFRLVAWLLFAATAPSGMVVGTLIGGGLAEHCVVHGHGTELPAQHAGNHAGFDTTSGPECPHCPATSCAMLAPCAAPQPVALHTIRPVWADPIQRLGPSVCEVHGLPSLVYLPPTPPPRKLS